MLLALIRVKPVRLKGRGIMLGWLRRFLTDSEVLERRIAGDLHASEERLSRRMTVIEQRLDDNEQVLRRLGHQVARIEGRASFLRSSITEPVAGASTDGDRPKT